MGYVFATVLENLKFILYLGKGYPVCRNGE